MREIDGILRDWGEVASKSAARSRKGRNVAGGKYQKPVKTPHISAMSAREKLSLTVRKAPEVMVKISGGGKDMRAIKAHFDYISRNGQVEIEDEQGQIHQGKEEVRKVRDDWKGSGIPYECGKKREAFNIVLSMPPGTDRTSVKYAAREFAGELFSNHQYVFAAHNDEKHPHIHLAVKAVDFDGVRLNPRKADLQHWRETFAEKLRDQGVEANATPRQLRGVVKRSEKQSVKHINRQYREGKRTDLAQVTQSQQKAVEREIKTGQEHINPAQDKINKNRKKIQHDYGTVARALATGTRDDKQLALDVVKFVQEMPAVHTKHADKVEIIKNGKRIINGEHDLEENKKDHGRSR